MIKWKPGDLGSDPRSAGGPLANLLPSGLYFLENKKIVLEHPKIPSSPDIP